MGWETFHIFFKLDAKISDFDFSVNKVNDVHTVGNYDCLHMLSRTQRAEEDGDTEQQLRNAGRFDDNRAASAGKYPHNMRNTWGWVRRQFSKKKEK